MRKRYSFNEYPRTCNTINLLTDSKVQYPKVGPGVWTDIALKYYFLKHLIFYISLVKIFSSFFSFHLDLKLFQFICLKNAWLSRFFHLFRLWYRQLLLIIWTSFKPTVISGSVPLLTLALYLVTVLAVRVEVKTELSYQNDTVVVFFFAVYKKSDNT